jgi:murein DD-endopeptidase MepM/ murein hydrolase activator NlpD
MRRRSPTLLGFGLMPLAIALSSCVGPSVPLPPVVATPPPAVAAPPPPLRVDPAPAIALDTSAAVQGGLLAGIVRPASATLALDGAEVSVASDGGFIVAFDRDAPPAARLVATGTRGSVEREIAVAPGNWRIENVNAPFRGSAANDAEFERRRAAETAQINAARRIPVTSDGWRQQFTWPVRGRLSGYFGAQRVYRGQPGSYHSGTDIAAGTGTPFYAPADGVVILAADAPFTLEGNLLMVGHGMGLSSAFLHTSRIDVRVGDVVRQGQQLGLVGATGRVSGPHMHWGMRWGSARIDPSLLAGPMR